MQPLSRSLFAAVVISVFLAGCSNAPRTAKAATAKADDEKSTDAKAPSSGKVAPDFTLKDSNGTTVHLSDYKGKVVLLDFWATWCGPCKIEIPWFMEFEQQLKSRGFAVLGVSMDEGGWAEVKPYIEEHKINYRIALGDDTLEKSYGELDALPTTLLIDRSGKIAAVHVGIEKGKNELREEIEHLLQNKQSARNGIRTAPAAFLTGPK